MTAEKVVGAKYVMVNNAGYLEGIYAVGTVITLINDDGTAMPLFRNAYGDRYFVRMRDVVKLVGEVPAETKEVPKLKFTELQKDTVYVESDGDYVMIASKPVAGKTLFVQRNFYGKSFIADYYNEGDVHSDGYTQATEEAVQEFNELFKQYVLENQQHITEEELAALEAGDKITLVDYLYEGHDFGAYCNEEMLPNAGKELTFSYHGGTGYAAACEGRWKYSHDMIASVKKAVKTITQDEFDSLEVGDKVTVRADLHTGLAVRNGVVTSMTELAGKTVTVTGLCNGDVKVDGRPQYWSKEMFTAVIKQEKPKFAVGDIVTTDGVLGTADWDIARRVTAVNMETRKYEMEWADGVVAEIDSPISFTEADACLTNYTGKVPTEETAKLEAAEKEHGYVPPLVNKVGTVIEAGKYYVLTGSSGTKRICKVYATQHKVGGFYKKPVLVDLEGSHAVSVDMEHTDLCSPYGKSAVPATKEQIALYDAAVALHEAKKALKYAV
ncbi:hypothetical protein P7G87_00340 [Enterococcus asini]|uniref:hypothetical protein n=1 Tax=Enterococcus asini TaxID=57732 RepID=UPI00288D1AF4|nr:hypothetical protein [Enterococcus asini]MDT2783135.1 hypothetical protein [Enterococcus asini]